MMSNWGTRSLGGQWTEWGEAEPSLASSASAYHHSQASKKGIKQRDPSLSQHWGNQGGLPLCLYHLLGSPVLQG